MSLRAAGLVPSIVLVAWALAGCAATTAPSPPPEEILLVVNSGDESLTLVFLGPDAPAPFAIPLGAGVPADARPAAGRRHAVVAVASGDAIAVVDLVGRGLTSIIGLGDGAGALGAVLINDTTAYVALSRFDVVMRVNLSSGDTASVAAGVFPKDVVFTRGRLFVLNANLAPCEEGDGFCPAGESWLTVIDPITNQRADGRDSIPLPGPGNASYAAVGGDGRLYVMSIGGPEAGPGRLSIVDPLSRSEVGSFGGFGDTPGPIAADRGERIMVSSRTEGLMEFNTRIRTVVRGAGAGIPVLSNAGVAIDSRGMVYAVESGACNGALAGRVRVFRTDLVESRIYTVGRCAGAASLALIPPEVLSGAR